jgi:sugar phosphate isomerase/epimerase
MDTSAILKYAETSFRRAHVAGIGIIVLGSGKARQIPEGFSGQEARRQFVELCRKMAPLAEKYKVTIVLEPLNKEECNFINSVAEGGDIVKEVNHPNFLLLADLYHMSKEGESPESILRYGHLLRHVHVAQKAGRSAPGTTPEDFTEYFRALRRVGYRGLISIECQWQNMEKQLPVAIQALRTQMAG